MSVSGVDSRNTAHVFLPRLSNKPLIKPIDTKRHVFLKKWVKDEK